ncbi:MAG: sulfotransferase [Rhodospirillales bacterium]
MDTSIEETRAERRIVFVGGLHRSGTTLIANLLARHPAIGSLELQGTGNSEGQYLQDVLPKEDAFGGPGLLAFNDGFSDPAGLAAADETAVRLHRAWETHWPANTPVVLEKTPGNLLRASLLHGLFPRARFLFVIRHPIAVALATQKWSHTGVFCLLQHWLAGYGHLDRLERAGIDHMLISYEDLLVRGEYLLATVADWLGLDPAPLPVPSLYDGNAPYFRRWQQCRIAGERLDAATMKRVDQRALGGRLRHIFLKSLKPLARQAFVHGVQISLAGREIAAAEGFFGEAVARYDYSLVDPSARPISYVFTPETGRVAVE